MSGWRETAKSPRFLIFDARLAFFWLLFFLHMRTWTLVISIVATVFFWLAEYMGYSLMMMLRNLRARIVGPTRSCRPWWRNGIMVLPLAVLLSGAVTGLWSAPAQAGFEIIPATGGDAAATGVAGRRHGKPVINGTRRNRAYEIGQVKDGKVVKRVRVGSFGRNIPLRMVAHALVPKSWKVILSKGVRNRLVSWEGQQTWRGALSTIAHDENLLLVIDGEQRRVVMQSNEAPRTDADFCRSLRALMPDGWTLRTDFESDSLKSSPWAFNTCR